MSQYFSRLDHHEQWYWAGMRIRLGLHPEEPRLFDHFESVSSWLHVHEYLTGWQVSHRYVSLLLDAAEDASLPVHWRSLCLDRVHGPLEHLACLQASEAEADYVRSLRQRLARVAFSPAEGPSAQD